MQIRSAATGLIVDSSLVIQETVILLSVPEHWAAIHASGTDERSVALCRMITANTRLEFVIVPSLFVEDSSLAMMSSGQGWRHTKYCPNNEGSIHTPPDPRPEASQNPRWVGSRRTIFSRWVGWGAVWSTSVCQSVILQWNSGDSHARSTPPWDSACWRW